MLYIGNESEKSKFISYSFKVETLEEVKHILEEIKSKWEQIAENIGKATSELEE